MIMKKILTISVAAYNIYTPQIIICPVEQNAGAISFENWTIRPLSKRRVA